MKRQIKIEFEGNTFSIEAERKANTLIITRDGKDYSVRIIPEETVAPKRMAANQVSAPIVAAEVPGKVPGGINAPMTGLVKEILVKAGAMVKAGQLVVIMEAMKMDIEVRSVSAGTVEAVYTAVDSNVIQAQPLLSIA